MRSTREAEPAKLHPLREPALDFFGVRGGQIFRSGKGGLAGVGERRAIAERGEQRAGFGFEAFVIDGEVHAMHGEVDGLPARACGDARAAVRDRGGDGVAEGARLDLALLEFA